MKDGGQGTQADSKRQHKQVCGLCVCECTLRSCIPCSGWVMQLQVIECNDGDLDSWGVSPLLSCPLLPHPPPTHAPPVTCLKGTVSVSCRPIITMRATQKNRMSWPVSSRLPG